MRSFPSGSDDTRDQDLADRIRLHRQVDRRSCIVVEGNSDRRFIQRILGTDVTVFVAGSRANVLRTALTLHDHRISGVACAIDQDFHRADYHQIPRVVAYDNADLEAMLWTSSALEHLLTEVGSAEKLHLFGGARLLRAAVVHALLPLTRLRAANALEGWGLNFDLLRLAPRVNRATLSIQTQSLCDALASTAPGGVERRHLYAVASEGSDEVCSYTNYPMVRGRDALVVTGVALRHLVGNLSHQQAAVERLEETLRLAATTSDVIRAPWYARLQHLLNS